MTVELMECAWVETAQLCLTSLDNLHWLSCLQFILLKLMESDLNPFITAHLIFFSKFAFKMLLADIAIYYYTVLYI